LVIHQIARTKTHKPTTRNAICIPNIVEIIPNPILHAILQTQPINVCTPVIEPELFFVECSVIKEEIAGLIIESPRYIPKETIIIPKNECSKAKKA
jgi:hypothetical protein